MPHDGEVVRDQDRSQPQLSLELLQQVHDLGLNRDVERAHRFVRDDEVGIQRQRPGHADPLALSARQLVRVTVGVGRMQTHGLEEPGDLARAIRARAEAVTSSGSAMLLPTVILGSSDAYGSWNTICTRRRSRF